jgi:benzoyl-CoA reductase/2-hydroxyglutaryl-CoA dehydratase subunit BcrC/BadD/HgdB
MPSLTIGAKKITSVLSTNLEKVGDGLPIVGYHFSFPAEFLTCFDCVPVCIEGISYYLAALLLHGSEKYYDKMNNWGHPFHTCTSQKGTMGMSLDDLIQFDSIICPTAPCDSTCASYPFFKYEKKFPLNIIDMPFLHEEKSYRYYGNQIKLALINLGKQIGQKPDFDRLKEHIELENEVQRMKLEIFEMIKAVPSPIENMYNPLSAGCSIFIAGTQENIDFYMEYIKIVKKRYKKGEHYGGEEKIRSIWPYMLTFFDISLCEWLDRELGMSILFDIFNYNFADPIDTSDMDAMFYGMAKKNMGFPMVRQSTQFYDTFIDDCIRMGKDFSADCYIYTNSIACKQFGSVPKIMREALMEEVGIPTLIIDFDCGDARMTSSKTFKEKIGMFVQTLL